MLRSIPLAFIALTASATIGLTHLIQPIVSQHIDPTANTHEYTFLSLGDSYTIGESVEVKDRWSVQLAEQLRKEGVDVAPPDIIARTGWTTAELTEAIEKSGNTKTYDLVSLLIGVNNQYRGQSLDRYRTELRELLQTAIRYAKGKPGRVMVLSIPDWGVTPYAEGRDRTKISAEIDAFNAICLQEARQAGVRFFNITPLSRQAQHDVTQVASDGLHYSGRQHRLWADQVRPEVVKMLKE
jgi:lysophospholipase L1-like esterase